MYNIPIDNTNLIIQHRNLLLTESILCSVLNWQQFCEALIYPCINHDPLYKLISVQLCIVHAMCGCIWWVWRMLAISNAYGGRNSFAPRLRSTKKGLPILYWTEYRKYNISRQYQPYYQALQSLVDWLLIAEKTSFDPSMCHPENGLRKQEKKEMEKEKKMLTR